ncbi:S46 family peptidase, partial [Mesorhizobium sp.]|uniref:S46 family peptidase n=1 Tax=Mesorhizobium sp. TaxID=1871066 RepID=UPI002627C6E2
PELGTLPVDFMSTVDFTNGNSGSATLNGCGEFVGLAFDGTLDGVISDWAYAADRSRSIHVDSRFMLWTMDKIDGAAAPAGRRRGRRSDPAPLPGHQLSNRRPRANTNTPQS